MSITDELRKYVQDWRETPNLMDDLDAGDVDGILADFESIADRIDAEHEKVMSRAGQLLDDAEKERDYNYAYWQDCKQKVLQGNITFNELNAKIECLEDELSHCIELPKDADGEPIHIGDVMENIVCPPVHREVMGVGVECFYGWDDGNGRYSQFDANCYRHHHAPTVEDVLREFAEKVTDSQIPGVHPTYEEAIAEYAAKLRLAGSDAE